MICPNAFESESLHSSLMSRGSHNSAIKLILYGAIVSAV